MLVIAALGRDSIINSLKVINNNNVNKLDEKIYLLAGCQQQF